jgi:hypothetical protein
MAAITSKLNAQDISAVTGWLVSQQHAPPIKGNRHLPATRKSMSNNVRGAMAPKAKVGRRFHAAGRQSTPVHVGLKHDRQRHRYRADQNQKPRGHFAARVTALDVQQR